jgi:hypothetical protein
VRLDHLLSREFTPTHFAHTVVTIQGSRSLVPGSPGAQHLSNLGLCKVNVVRTS